MSNPHILVIPYPAQGHVIPLMELSKSLAEYGFKITFVNTQHNHELLKNVSAMEGCDIGDGIHLVSVSDGLESTEDKNKPGNSSETILRVMPGKVAELIEQINATDSNKISCVLADQSIGWALEIAEKKEIRRAAFCPAAAASLVQGLLIPTLIEDGIIDTDGTPTRKQRSKFSKDIPATNPVNFVWTCLGNMDAQRNIFGLMVRNNESIKLTDWVLCNSTYDLEPSAFQLAPQILPIGPLSARNRIGESAGSFWPQDSTCLEWLDQHGPKSVIYVAFGSFAIFKPIQFQELALGLELTNRPFLWVVRSDVINKDSDIFVQEFLIRVGNLGKIVSWAPQHKVLEHPSVGCFISHCGWNSTIEGVSNGVPFLCWPYFADQFINQSYICDVWEIGLGFKRDVNGIITAREIKSKVEEILGNEKFKANALALKEIVVGSVKEGGSSSQNFTKFVEWVKAR